LSIGAAGAVDFMCGIDCTAVCKKTSETIKKEVGYECIHYYVPGCNVNIDNIYTAAQI
jgi:hypothetical protein